MGGCYALKARCPSLSPCVLQMSIKLLIEAARDWEGMQFILLTPQEVGAIGKAEADVREDSEQNGKKELPPDFVTIQQMASARVDRSHA